MKQIYNILWDQFKHQFLRILIIFFLIVGTVIFDTISPVVYKLLIDNVFGGQPLVDVDNPLFGPFINPIINALFLHFHTPYELGTFIIVAYFIIDILLSLIDYTHLYTTQVVIQKAVYDLSKAAFRNLESYNIGFFRKIDLGDYIYRLANDVHAIGDMLSYIITITTSTLFLIFTTVVMFTISTKLTIISFMTLPFLAVTLVIFNRRVSRATTRSELANSTLYSFMQQVLNQLKTVQAYSQEQTMSVEFNRTEKESLNAQRHLQKINFSYDLVIGLAMAIIYSTIFFYGMKAVFAHELTAGWLIFFTYLMDNLTNPMISLADSIFDYKQSHIRLARLSEFFDEKSHIENKGTIEQIPNNAINFQNVTLVGEENFIILDNVSCHIPKNKITIIAGISGSGKTSFISLIPRLLDKPTSGQILLGNIDISLYPVNVLREKIAFVAQENSLFNHTIRNIITFGKPNASYEEIQQAAQLACAEEFILRRPEGYSYRVGEGGNYLSGGQRQRLMLARAFVKDAEIQIFDEPFSNLDQDTKRRVWHNIKNNSKNKTTIIVSNILDFISQADYIILLTNGKLKYEGTYKDLQNKSELVKLLLEDV